MSVGFRREEMISATQVAKNFGKVISDLTERRREKTVVVRNNEIAAVILSVEEYEYLADLVEFVEHLDIYETISDRNKEDNGERISLETILQEENRV